ncbi:MAG: phosphatase PAP2 family protein [Deltaproteobacteria bacterium]|nr:phosphatase PAP2 family protein [Deltaproteobacteria bacterium]
MGRDAEIKTSLFWSLVFPIALAVILSVIISWTETDLKIAEFFYASGKGWFMGQEMPWFFLYHYGNIPGIILAVGGFFVFVLGFFRKELRPYKKTGLFLVLFMLLGPGLVVNTLFKDHWGRPRPDDIVNFGGTKTFHQAWEIGEAGQGGSFPSGHASIGFFIFAPFFILRKSRRKAALAFLGLGIAFGFFMGAGRIVQGGHFLTDVIWSGLLTYLTGFTLAYVFRLDRR